MRAALCTGYGPPDVLRVEDVERPTPRDDEILVKVHASTVASADVRVRAADFPTGFAVPGRLALGILRPRRRILGTDLSGEIEAVGKGVTLFKEGEQVFASTGAKFGAHAEYVALPETAAIAHKPLNMTHEEAAALPFGGSSALYHLRELGGIQSGQDVLIYGASGAVGTAAVQLARHFGADVTGVCSAANHELVRSLGASHLIDYTSEDFTRSGKTYDLILDAVGTTSFSHCKRALKRNGRYVSVVVALPQFARVLWSAMTGGKQFKAGVAPERKEDLILLKQLVEGGQFKAVIDRRYPLEQVAEAHRYVDAGHKKGNVVLSLARS